MSLSAQPHKALNIMSRATRRQEADTHLKLIGQPISVAVRFGDDIHFQLISVTAR